MLRTELYKTIKLDEIEKAQLMNRVDRKYWFNQKVLQDILLELHDDYYILSVEGQQKTPYQTVYYDTDENEMYTAHHNGKLNRFKIRKRTYKATNASFLEIKFKTNKGRTIKTRIPSNNNKMFTRKDVEFLNNLTPYDGKELKVALVNNFYRVTLVNKNLKERCTIDTNLRFWNNKQTCSLKNLVIVEIKTELNGDDSPFEEALKKRGIYPAGFSKYCIGRSMIDYDIKKNAFKKKLRRIEKVIREDRILISKN